MSDDDDATPEVEAGAEQEAATMSGPIPLVDPRNEPLTVVRVATVPLIVPPGMEWPIVSEEAQRAALVVDESIRTALEADSRVTLVLPPTRGERAAYNAHTVRLWDQDFDLDSVASGESDFVALRLPSSISFRVHVPRKNQPNLRGSDDVPVEDYLVSWNGLVALVAWEPAGNHATSSGGHVVLDLISDAAHAAGFQAPTIACTTGCRHRFAHLNLLVAAREPVPDSFERVGDSGTGVHIRAPFPKSDDDVHDLRELGRRLMYPLELFAVAHSFGYRVASLDSLVGDDGTSLMHLNYLVAHRHSLLRLQGWRDRWHLRRWRRVRRELIASMWLEISTIERLTPRWRDHSEAYAAFTAEAGAQALQAILDPETSAVSSIDVTAAKQTLADVGTRMDTRQIFYATLLGALAAAGAAFIGAWLA